MLYPTELRALVPLLRDFARSVTDWRPHFNGSLVALIAKKYKISRPKGERPESLILRFTL